MAEEEEGDGEELTTPQPVWGKLILEVCPPIGLHEGRLICAAITEYIGLGLGLGTNGKNSYNINPCGLQPVLF